MRPIDLADVGYDAFLINGTRQSTIATDSNNQDQMLLRIINGSTSSYFDVEYASGPMTIIVADGLDVEPIRVKRLRFSTAATYDVLVPFLTGQFFELRVTYFDGSGFGSTFVGEGTHVYAPDIPAPDLFLMSHQEMEMEGHRDMSMDMEVQSSSAGQNQPIDQDNQIDLTVVTIHDMSKSMPMTDVIEHMTDYRHLMSIGNTELPANQVWREVEISLTGNMERYVWSFNGKTLRETNQIRIDEKEKVHFLLNRETMMHHPIHLHDHFFRVLNPSDERSPLKHTVNLPPMGSVVIEFDTNDEKDWLFHCHNQYHMKSGMNRVVRYEGSSLFNSAMATAIQPMGRWYTKNEVQTNSGFFGIDYIVSDARHGFSLEMDSDFDEDHESVGKYSYHFRRFVSAFAGVEDKSHDGESRTGAIAAVQYKLPMLISNEWRIDNAGDFRLELNSQLQLTRRLGIYWRWNRDDEYRYDIFYTLSKRWSLTLDKDSDYSAGVGISILF